MAEFITEDAVASVVVDRVIDDLRIRGNINAVTPVRYDEAVSDAL